MKTNKIRLTGLIFLLAVFTIMNQSCGGGGGSSLSGNMTAVSLKMAAATSSDIAKLRFTISAPDMATIERTVDVSVTQPPSPPPPPKPYMQASLVSGDIILENFDVPNGLSRHVVVEGLDAAGAVIYIGDAYVDLDGTPKSIEITLSPAPINLSGNWSIFHTPQGGTEQGPGLASFTQSGNSVTFTLTDQTGKTLTGSGTISGNNIQFSFLDTRTNKCNNPVTVSLTGTISTDGNTMSGTYTESGSCGATPGTWRMVKQSTTASASDFVGTWTGTFTFFRTDGITETGKTVTVVFALSNGSLTGTVTSPIAIPTSITSAITVTNGILSFALPNDTPTSPDCARWNVTATATLDYTLQSMNMTSQGTFCSSTGGVTGIATATLTKLPAPQPPVPYQKASLIDLL